MSLQYVPLHTLAHTRTSRGHTLGQHYNNEAFVLAAGRKDNGRHI